jgi:3-hydroxyacyl-CoA dehydrogenase
MKPAAIRGAMPRDVGTIAVVGGGLMGAGIAASCLSAGLEVVLIERDAEAAAAARARVAGILDGAVKRGKARPAETAARLDRLVTTDDDARAAQADLAIEAVFEDLAVKHAVFARLAAVLAPDAILATNTSYLDPLAIAAGLPGPERVLGLHFFSPAHVMRLVEIVRTPATAPDVLATGFALAKRLGKTGVLSGVCDGFIGNRMLSAYRRQADYLLADGCLPHEIDTAMRAFGLPMGPYELAGPDRAADFLRQPPAAGRHPRPGRALRAHRRPAGRGGPHRPVCRPRLVSLRGRPPPGTRCGGRGTGGRRIPPRPGSRAGPSTPPRSPPG